MKTFILVVKILIPIAFFGIATITKEVNISWGNSIAGVMTIVVIAMYLAQYVETQK